MAETSLFRQVNWAALQAVNLPSGEAARLHECCAGGRPLCTATGVVRVGFADVPLSPFLRDPLSVALLPVAPLAANLAKLFLYISLHYLLKYFRIYEVMRLMRERAKITVV